MIKPLMILLACLLIPGMIFNSHAVQGEPVVLKMNHQFPDTTSGSAIDQWFADQVALRTTGQVIIKIFWSNGLGEPRDNLSLLKRGVLEMAAMSPGYFPEEMPLLAAPNAIPMAMDTVCQSSHIMKALLDSVPAIAQEASSQGVKPLFFHPLNPYLLVTKEPVRRLEDLKGKRIRTWSNEMAALIHSAGGHPVPLFLQDVLPALGKNIIDGCPFSVDLVKAYGIYKIAPNITDVILWEGPAWGVWISETAWGKLAPGFREIMLTTAEAVREREIPIALEAGRESRDFLKQNGVTFHSFPRQDLDRWKAEQPDFFEDFILQMKPLGKQEAARQMVTLWKAMRMDTTCP